MANQELRAALAGRMRVLRAQRALSQEELADRAHLHRTAIGLIEQGRRTPTLDTLKKIADGLEVTLAELVSF